MITLLGAYPSLAIGPLLDRHKHDIGAILRESLEAEGKALALYRELLRCAEGRSVALEEYARQMVYAEELHADEVDKMLRTPGEVAAFEPNRRRAATTRRGCRPGLRLGEPPSRGVAPRKTAMSRAQGRPASLLERALRATATDLDGPGFRPTWRAS
jgi:hypothetical protein